MANIPEHNDHTMADLTRQLDVVLADTYVLAVKTHGYHWNVTGPHFMELHTFFGTQYESLFAAADEIAERLRALGALAPGGMAQFLAHASVDEAGTEQLSADAMIRDLIKSNGIVVNNIAQAIKLAGEAGDDATQDLMIQRRSAHEKTLWMLRSLAAAQG